MLDRSMLHRAKILASIWGAIVVSLALMFWMFIAPQHYSESYESPEACNAAKPGMSMQEALTALEAKAFLNNEALDGNTLSVGWCYVKFENGKATDISVGGRSTIE